MQRQNKNYLLTGGFICTIAVVFAVGFFVGKSPSVSGSLLDPSVKKQPTIINGLGSTDRVSSASILTLPSNTPLYQQVSALLDQKFTFKDKVPTDSEKLYGAIKGMVGSYKDPYTTFFPPEESKMFAADVRGSFGGVGMEVGLRENAITVIAPLKDSPAEKAGILSGDIIFKIDGKTTEKLDVDTAVSKIRGEKGTTVILTLIRKGKSAPFDISLVRETISIPTLDTDIVSSKTGKAFRISLYSFSEDSAGKFDKALKEFNASPLENLILDLRDNPGGYLDAAIIMGSEFLPAGTVIVKEDMGTQSEPIVHRSSGLTTITKPYKLITLVNGGSASASEILAGALSENKKSTLVGTKTFGKGSVQELVDLPDGSSLKVTVARWLTPNGVSISEQGIHPDTELKDSPEIQELIKQKKDPVIEAALPLFKKALINQPNK